MHSSIGMLPNAYWCACVMNGLRHTTAFECVPVLLFGTFGRLWGYRACGASHSVTRADMAILSGHVSIRCAALL